MAKQTKSIFRLLITAMIWGFAFVAQLIGANYVEPFTFNGPRFLLGALSLIPVILVFERVKTDKATLKKTFVAGILAGLALFSASTLQQFGIVITGSAGKAGFITGLYTVLVPIIGIFLKRRTNMNIWIGAVLAVIGLYLLTMTGGFGSVGIGDVILLIGAVLWATHIIIIDHFGNEIYSLRFAFTQFMVSALLSLIGAFIFEDVSLCAIMDAKFPILYAGIMSVGVAYTCQIIGQKNADPTFAAIVLSTESVFSAIGEAVVLGLILVGYDYTPMSVAGYIGCAVMFCGIVVSQLDFRKIKR